MTHRFSDSFRNWLRHSDVPEQLPQTMARLEQHPDPHPFTVPADSDVQEGAIRVSRPQPPRNLLIDNYTPDGTYIPLGGGVRGWYENSGVLNNELPNHYRFQEALHGDAFKKTILKRIETFNRRGGGRFQVDLWVRHSDPDHPDLKVSHRAYCLDLSLRGAKLRVRQALEPGELIVVSFFQQKADVEEGSPLTSVIAKVQHCHPAAGPPDNPRFYVGVEYVEIEIAAKETIAKLMSSGRALVPAAS